MKLREIVNIVKEKHPRITGRQAVVLAVLLHDEQTAAWSVGLSKEADDIWSAKSGIRCMYEGWLLRWQEVMGPPINEQEFLDASEAFQEMFTEDWNLAWANAS